jgi:type IV pilus assembly protein PilB
MDSYNQPQAPSRRVRIGDILVNSSLLTVEQLQEALNLQKEYPGKKLGLILVELGYITEDKLIEVLHMKMGVPIIDLEGITVPKSVLDLIPKQLAEEKLVFPFQLVGINLLVATSDPLDFDTINQLSGISGKKVEVALTTRKMIIDAINRNYQKHVVEEIASKLNVEAEHIDKKEEVDELLEMETRIGDVPVVKLINNLLIQAHQRRASDIHIEPGDDVLRVRFRIDGELVLITTLDMKVHGAIVTRVKIMSEMDIAERRIPLDGRFTVEVKGANLNIRAASMPTIFGEKIVMRINEDSKKGILPLESIGMPDELCNQIRNVIKNPNGLILLSGPTGSGKSTTLYSILNEISKISTNVTTIEDPVEKVVPGVNQTQTNNKAGLTFATGLRALLRQDPDKIMIGEIRDTETGDIAARAAITGHLVFASIHTNSAAATYMRMVDMGIEPYLITSSLIYIIAQRLVKLICPHCKTKYEPTEDELIIYQRLERTPPMNFYYGKGCSRCENTGSLGRRAIHEAVVTDNQVRKMVLERADTTEIENYLRDVKQQKFLIDRAMELVEEGTIHVTELYQLYQYEE